MYPKISVIFRHFTGFMHPRRSFAGFLRLSQDRGESLTDTRVLDVKANSRLQLGISDDIMAA